MINVITYIFKLLFYILIIGGSLSAIYFLIASSGSNYTGRLKLELKNRMRKLYPFLSNRLKRKNRFRDHIYRLNYIVASSTNKNRAYLKFLFLTVSVFAVVFASLILSIKDMPSNFIVDNPFTETIQGASKVGETSVNLFFPLVASVFAASIPYLRLRYKYSIAKIRISYELLDVVRLMAGETHLAVGPALINVSSELKYDSPIRFPLKELGELIASYKDDEELMEGCRKFSNAVDTAFAVSFISMIIHTEKEGRNQWEASLFSLADDMEKQRMAILDAKSSSRDAINLASYGNILVFVIVSISMAAFLKPNVYFNLQFRTNDGLAGLTLSWGLIIASYISTKFLTRIRLDY